MPTSSTKQVVDPAVAIRSRLAATLLTAIASALIRVAGQEIPIGQLVFFRSSCAAIILLVAYASRGETKRALSSKRPLGHLLRGLAGVISMSAYVGALVYLPLVDATVITYSAPIATVIFAAVFLRERVGIYRWSAVGAGFLGVLVMVSSATRSSGAVGGATLGAMLAVLSAITAATSTIQVRRLTETETTSSIVFYFYLSCSAISALTLPFSWQSPSLHQWGAIVIIGGLSAAAQLLTTESSRRAPASMLAPFDYTIIIWTFVVGYLFLDELPQKQVYLGALIISASGLFIIWRERHLARMEIERPFFVSSPGNRDDE